MTAAVDSPLTLQEWLDRLCSADDHHDARAVAIAAIAAGYQLERVECTRCSPFSVHTFTGACRHVIQTEAAWRDKHRDEDGPRAALHKPGDLRPASASEQREPETPLWTSTPCRSCQAAVIWADTPRGSRMPVDAEPDPAGNVILTIQANLTRPPLAIIVHTEAQRAEVAASDLHTSHFATCPNADKHRRPR